MSTFFENQALFIKEKLEQQNRKPFLFSSTKNMKLPQRIAGDVIIIGDHQFDSLTKQTTFIEADRTCVSSRIEKNLITSDYENETP